MIRALYSKHFSVFDRLSETETDVHELCRRVDPKEVIWSQFRSKITRSNAFTKLLLATLDAHSTNNMATEILIK